MFRRNDAPALAQKYSFLQITTHYFITYYFITDLITDSITIDSLRDKKAKYCVLCRRRILIQFNSQPKFVITCNGKKFYKLILSVTDNDDDDNDNNNNNNDITMISQ